MDLTIRPATRAELPTIVRLEILANKDHPFMNIPWAKPEDVFTTFLDSWSHNFDTDPNYHYVVAVLEGQIVGQMIWFNYSEPGAVPEYIPVFPEGTNEEFFKYVKERAKEKMALINVEGFTVLRSLAVSPEHQRKGIGAALMKYFMGVLDEEKVGCFLRASAMGKPLYSKLGFQVVLEFDADLSRFGWEKQHYSWYMARDPVG